MHQVEAVIHFDDDTEVLQQWDQQVMNIEYLCIHIIYKFSNLSWYMTLLIVGVCQALNDILDSMAKKGMAVPV